MHNLTKSIAVLSLFLPTSVYPLGIGEIKLHSALNQNLDADIGLFLSQGESISDIRVRLAPPEKFDEAGVPWSYFLSKIKFEPVEQRNGSAIVKLSSTEILREPFLDFLLEVSWSKGNLYREFTVLVDPPASYAQPTIPVIQKAKQEVLTRTTTPVEVSEATNVVYETLDSQYGPTDRSDSLWKVAEKTNIYDDISIEQMMMAIYKANPNAFYKDNVNALMAEKVIEIPEREVLLQLSQKQAMKAFKEQNIAWNRRVEANNQTQQSVSERIESNAQLELEAPVEAEINEAVVVISENDTSNLGITQPETESDSEKALTNAGVIALQSRMEKLEQQLEMMQKKLVLKDEQIAALQHQNKSGPVSEANNTQSDLAETIIQPNQEQGILAPEVKAEANTKPKVEEKLKINTVEKTTAKVVEKPKEKSIEKAKVKPRLKSKPKTKPIVQQESDTGGYLTMVLGSLGVAILGLLGFFWWYKNKDEELSESESMFASASEISMPDSSAEEPSVPVADDTSYDVGTVGESSFLSEFTPSDFDAFDTSQDEIDPISEADVYLAYGRYQQAEDLMRQAISTHPERDECKLKLLEIFYANENKIAFQEYSEELVNSEKHNDHEFWAKVIEMGAELDPENSLFTEEAGGKANFDSELLLSESTESVIADNAKNNTVLEEDSAANSIVDKDNEVDEIGETIVDESKISTAVLTDGSDNEIDFDLSSFDNIEDHEKEDNEVKTDENNLDIGFDLSSFDLDLDKIEDPDVDSKVVESVEYDLASGALGDLENVSETQEVFEEQSDDNSLDFDLSIFDQEESSSDQISTEPNRDINVSGEEAESIGLDSTLEHESNDESIDVIDLTAEIETGESLDDFDFSLDTELPDLKEIDSVETEKISEQIENVGFDLDLSSPPSDTKTLNDQESDVSDLTDMDELETKIDLAKAYIDMGDDKAAKLIADEVLEKGNDGQKKTAQAIVDQLK